MILIPQVQLSSLMSICVSDVDQQCEMYNLCSTNIPTIREKWKNELEKKNFLGSRGSRIFQTGWMGVPTPEKEVKTFNSQDFCRKLHENKRNWTGGAPTSLASLASAMGTLLFLFDISTFLWQFMKCCDASLKNLSK